MLSIGLMSGTSMDGVDAALLETDGTPNQIKPLAHYCLPYDNAFKVLLKAAEFSVKKFLGDRVQASKEFLPALKEYLGKDNEDSLLLLSDYLAKHQLDLSLDHIIQHSTFLHATAVKNLLVIADMAPNRIDVVGYHGQTLYHSPENKLSVIVGDGQSLADLLSINVVNDFRSQDIAAGGQGAPLAPLYHFGLAVRDKQIPLAVVNCGGIANMTVIPSDNENDLIAFDTGPGNCLVDKLVKQRTHHQESMDENGKYGMQGNVHLPTLAMLQQEIFIPQKLNYFSAKPPKALDVGDMKLPSILNEISLEDACATLEVFTAQTIVDSLQHIEAAIPRHWILAGGGWYNPVITAALKTQLQQKLGSAAQIQTADEMGWSTDFLEAELFAYLAVRSLKSLPISLPNTTKVPVPMLGGVIHNHA